MKPVTRLGLVMAFVLAGAAAQAQDFTAGKTPAQLFGSDCSACHRSPAGLAKNRDARTLAGFLREHYTTKPETAESLAAYVMTGASSAPPDKRGRNAAAAPAATDAGAATPERGSDATDRRARREAAAAGEDPRRRRPVSISGDGEKRSATPREDAGGPRTADSTRGRSDPGAEAALSRGAPSVRRGPEEGTQARGDSRSGEGGTTAPPPIDSISRLKAYAASGLDVDGTAGATAPASGKSHRAHGAVSTAPETDEASAGRQGAEVPAPASPPAAPAAASAAPAASSGTGTAPANPTPPAASAPPVAAAGGAALVPPRLSQ